MQRSRWIVALVLALAAPAAAQGPNAPPASDEIRVTLLGTGSPPPLISRFGPSTLVEAGPEKLVFDAGRGVTQRLWQAGVDFRDVTGVFLTHLHSDHVVGLPDLWLTGWLLGRRAAPLPLAGPDGTTSMARHLEEAFAFDVAARESDDHTPASGAHFAARDVVPGVVLDRNGVRVTAFEVDHSPVKPAFGYRIDYRGRSVVLSGDTRYAPEVVRQATGVDLLVHEVAATFVPGPDGAPTLRKWHHTNPAEAGDVFRQAHPKLAVFSHIVSQLSADSIVRMTRATYRGPLVFGLDLMRFRVGDSVRVERLPADSTGRR